MIQFFCDCVYILHHLSSATVVPQVTVHPVDLNNIVPGSDVSFSVTATGTEPLSYQWQKDVVDLTDGGSITGAVTSTLTIADVMESDEGGYRCVVTNTAGMDTSNTAVLTVGKEIGVRSYIQRVLPLKFLVFYLFIALKYTCTKPVTTIQLYHLYAFIIITILQSIEQISFV